ncbi:MAG: YihY/virulence factor BrkB family protein [Mucilaginibacter polytrichastri]|nr:YihY/virulence factor BrkB family protein [Mucilaginibacter polytrichastri]
MNWFERFLEHNKVYQTFIRWSKRIILPGFHPLPLYTIAVFFFKELGRESVLNKASSLAYSFMLAIFPGIIFLFTLIPYIPIANFQNQLLTLIGLVLPHEAYTAFRTTLEDIIQNQNGKLLSFGFISAMIFATNGMHNLMDFFNKATLTVENRSWINQRLTAIYLTFTIALALLGGITILIIGEYIIRFFRDTLHGNGIFWVILITFVRWLIVVVIFFIAVAVIYRYGPANPKRWRIGSPGAILATGLAILTSLGFSFYINNFGTYNKIYGSIGTLIVIMLWLWFNSLIILIGFELNASIDLGRRDFKVPVLPKKNEFRPKS